MTAFKQESTYLRAKDALAALVMRRKEDLTEAIKELTRLNAAETMEKLKATPEYREVLDQHGFY